MKIDDSLPGAPYEKAAAALRAAITEGELPLGTKLPTQADLAKQLEVAPMTLRRAIDQLKKEGLLRSTHGVGVFVTAPGTATSDMEKMLADIVELRRRVERLEQQVHEGRMGQPD